MDEYKCAFSAPLITEEFGCAHARPVTRRGGPDVACTSDHGQQRCEALFLRLKSVALPAFGVEDDLLSMPHSVLQKIQYGGLLGLQRLLGGDAAPVSDVHALVTSAVTRYREVAAVPVSELVADMTGYRLRGRRGK